VATVNGFSGIYCLKFQARRLHHARKKVAWYRDRKALTWAQRLKFRSTLVRRNKWRFYVQRHIVIYYWLRYYRGHFYFLCNGSEILYPMSDLERNCLTILCFVFAKGNKATLVSCLFLSLIHT
jgi:hypothetical protein